MAQIPRDGNVFDILIVNNDMIYLGGGSIDGLNGISIYSEIIIITEKKMYRTSIVNIFIIVLEI